MLKRISTVVVSLVFLVGCKSTSDSERKGELATDQPELAPCSALADVPQGATSCLLDLGQGKDTYWSDSDGVAPGEAGCHYEFADDSCSEPISERTFGELCLDSDRLVESNPGKDECHAHGRDQGKPDVVSCSEWCSGQGMSTGRCVGDQPASGEYGSCTSARCECG